MSSKLPEYVVNCLVASGFDTKTALTTLDLSDKPGNSPKIISKFISKKYPNEAQYKCDASSNEVEFLPGHINLIKELVEEITKVPLKRRCTSSNPPSKKRAISAQSSATSEESSATND